MKASNTKAKTTKTMTMNTRIIKTMTTTIMTTKTILLDNEDNKFYFEDLFLHPCFSSKSHSRSYVITYCLIAPLL